MVIVAVCNQKGGVGKTTVAVNLAYRLDPGERRRNLVIDADPQGNATTICGIELAPQDLTLNDALAAVASGSPASHAKDAIRVASDAWNMDVMPSNRLLASRETDVSLGRESRLQAIIEAVKDDYGHIVIDCPPSLGMLTTNALVAADKALIVTTPRETSVDGVAEMVNTIATVRTHYNPRLTLAGILINEWRSDRVDRRLWAEALESYYHDYVLPRFIPERESIAKACSAHTPITDEDTDVTTALNALVQTLIEKG
ncbi:ParA family protein [Actinotignum urinale]|uniref:ParA family protein n=1 Tax=Actinotignum urinale TaxID=190146 RepID=UPI0003B549BB|nr:ParA family protein [Actinotignum urinale]MDY5160975.1 ParA family protein [Actinotignum urinale]